MPRKQPVPPRQPMQFTPVWLAFRDQSWRLWILGTGKSDACCICGQWVYAAMACYQRQPSDQQQIIAHTWCCEVARPAADQAA